jgi:hypothetical protein
MLLVPSLDVSQNHIVAMIGVQALYVCSVCVFSSCFLPLRVTVEAIMYFGVEHVYGSGTEGQPGSFSHQS